MALSMKNKIIISSVSLFVIGAAGVLFFGSSKSSNETDTPKVKVKKASSAKPAAAARPQHKLHDLVMKMLDQDKGENIVSIFIGLEH